MPSVEHQDNNTLRTPQLPQVTRLNRNVLLVAAMGVGVVILGVTHVVRGDKQLPSKPVASTVEAGSMASFLKEQPPADTPIVPPPVATPVASTQDASFAKASLSSSSESPLRDSSTPESYERYRAIEPRGRAVPDGDELYTRAVRARLRVQGPAVAPTSKEQEDEFANLAIAQHEVEKLLRSSSIAVSPELEARRFAAPLKSNTGSADRHSEFLAKAGAETGTSTAIASRLEEPLSPYQIMAGTLLPAMLVTGINSDLPGDILAQVSRNVYDSQQRHLLIPRGTRLIGRYDNQVALGQSRILIAWTRLILPDGRSLSLPGLPTKDLAGAAGLHDRVDNHYTRLYGQALLLSIIGAGAQLSQPQQSRVFSAATPGQIAAGAVGQELAAVSMETIRRNMDVRPTLQLRPGTAFYVFLERDLVLDGAYGSGR